MKKNYAMRLASVLLICTIVTACLTGSTFAKYTSSAAGSDSVTVAKWSILVNNADITQTDETTFNLFDTILDTGGTAETDVATGKIAPGTSGAFDLVIKNDSEVSANYGVTFAVTGAAVPLEYSLDGTNYSTSLSNVSTTQLAQGAEVTVKVYWRWAFEGGADAADTALGVAASTVTVTATITATQVD